MLPDLAPHPIARFPHQPELKLLCAEHAIGIEADSERPFVLREGRIVLGRPSLDGRAEALFHLRHAIELAWLAPLAEPPLAGLAAARAAALAIALETYGAAGATVPGWIAPLTGYGPPDLSTARRIWAKLAAHQPEAGDSPLGAEAHARLAAAWPLLGPAEWLMEQGGDARLGIDPFTGLNGYGCSHRPRPWAVTFASSTASSCSERGYLGAEAARRDLVAASLAGSVHAAIGAQAEAVRAGLARAFDLPEGTGILLAPSGTDAELFALALVEATEDRPVTNILLAPEETGSGVPLAARGRHFAADTARGVPVEKGEVVAGYRGDTTLANIAVRGADGAVRPEQAIDADCLQAVAEAVAAGRRPVLHLLDVSKTGLRAPSTTCAMTLATQHGARMDVLVDACQARLHPGTIQDYLARGWMVAITGSKFFTGPPFAGALLVPEEKMRRLRGVPLAEGLALYCGPADWPADAPQPRRPAAEAEAELLPGNVGLLMRWQAAIAEMRAFAAVPAERRRHILHRFVRHVEASIATTPGLVSVSPHGLTEDAGAWDLTTTIRCFALRRTSGGISQFLDLAEARKVYIWLNADLTEALGTKVSPAERPILARRCHIGQPVAITLEGQAAAALRVSAGARLVSGEPSLAHLDGDERLEQELRDVSLLFAKVGLILAHMDWLTEANPRPTYA
ncbi:hypothetical protein AcidC75_28570 [Acidisoma sp. C75]